MEIDRNYVTEKTECRQRGKRITIGTQKGARWFLPGRYRFPPLAHRAIAIAPVTSPPATPAISCATCKACCCRLEVLLMGDDDVPRRFTVEDAWGGEVMRRLDDGWCAALDRETMLCTIYERRPNVCREYAVGDSDCLVERLQLAVIHLPARA
ncbi:MAG: YkgJ family cysteine cluster protein [Rhodocyclaceae bacterium]